jgi:hypothetical protein
MNILNFDRWIKINEGQTKFDAIIKADKDNNTVDEIVIESPDGNEKTEFTIGNKDNADSIETTEYVRVNDNEWKEKENSKKTIEDTRIKKNILHASHLISKVQDDMRAKELDRLTGGDFTSKTKELIRIYDNTNEKEQGINLFGSKILPGEMKCEYTSFEEILSNSKYKYALNNNNLSVIYKLGSNVGTRIGKGEYLLPLLFNDVYKNTIYSEGSKGDNHILVSTENGDEKYALEVKSPNAPFSFSENALKYVDDKNNNDIIDKYKNAITTSILEYAFKRKVDDKIYLCFFAHKNIKKSPTPTGLFFINLCGISEDIFQNPNNSIFNTIKNMLRISTHGTSLRGDVALTVKLDNDGETKIDCTLNKKYFGESKNQIKIDNSSSKYFDSPILSRDNFVNTQYKKERGH